MHGQERLHGGGGLTLKEITERTAYIMFCVHARSGALTWRSGGLTHLLEKQPGGVYKAAGGRLEVVLSVQP